MSEENDDVANAIAAMEALEPEVEEQEEVVEEPEAEDTTEDEPTEEPEVEDEPQEEAEKEESSPGLEKLAAKERKYQEAREGWKIEYEAEKEELADLIDEVAPWVDAVEAWEGSKATARMNPVAHLKTLGIDSEEDLRLFAEAVWVEVVGDEAPDEWKQRAADNDTKRKIRELEAKFEKEKPEEQVDSSYDDEYVGQITEEISQIDADKYPFISGENSAEVVNYLYNYAVDKYKNDRIVPEIADIVSQLEKDLEGRYEALTKKYSKKKSKEKEEESPKTISKRKSQTRSSKSKRKPMTEQEEIRAAVKAMEEQERLHA